MGRIRIAALALLVTAGAQPVSAIPPPEGKLTIVGAGNTYSLITLREETTYDLWRATVDYAGGRWGGFVIVPDSPDPKAWRDRPTLRSVYDQPYSPLYDGYPARRDYSTINDRGVLRPGRYRVYLFTDGQEVTVQVPWSEPSRTLYPDAPAKVRIQVKQVAVPVSQTSYVETLRQDGGTRSMTHAAMRLNVVTEGEWETCFARSARLSSPCLAGRQVYARAWGGGYASHSGRFDMYGPSKDLYWRAEVDPGASGLLTLMSLRYNF